MPIISKPLNIGAEDLLRGVDKSYCDWVDVLTESFLRKKWKQRYCIISQGCLYMYPSRNAKKPEQSFSLNLVQCVEECEPESGQNICFRLRYKNTKMPILFSCDTMERRKNWIDTLSSEITKMLATLYKMPKSEITDEHSTYNLSADSGFGSAGTVSSYKPDISYEYYDEVDKRRFNEAASPSQTCDENREYEMLKPAGRPYCNDGNQHTKKKEQCDSKVATLNEELKMTIGKIHVAQKKRTTDGHSLLDLQRNLSMQASTTSFARNSMPLASCASLSFLDVRNRNSSVGIEESQPVAKDDAELYVNVRVSNGSSDSGNTSPKIIYENPEELQSAEQHFKENEYFCDGEDSVKRLLKREEVGAFAVYRGESTPYKICVMTPNGLKYFRLYEQNGRVSLFQSNQIKTFGSLGELLSHYRTTDLPGSDYKVKLLRGYNSNRQ